MSRNNVVNDAKMGVGAKHINLSFNESRESLRGGVFVGKVNVAIQKHSVGINDFNSMRVNDFLIKRFCHRVS